MVRDVIERSVTAHAYSLPVLVKWCTEVDAIDNVGPSYPPASNGHISILLLFDFVQRLPIFLKDNPQSRVLHLRCPAERGYTSMNGCVAAISVDT
ncbi:hypothetical protein TNCV_1850531 [Trichonephila clavipes]|nr:hypothetical protein TNCV_1850531 [Trichonephila clavipes]